MSQSHSFFFQEHFQILQEIVLAGCSLNFMLINLNAALCNYLFRFNKVTFILNFWLFLSLITLLSFQIILSLQALELFHQFLFIKGEIIFVVIPFQIILFLLCPEALNFLFLIILENLTFHYSLF